MTPLEFGILCGALFGLTGFLYGYTTGRCSKDNPCPKCSYHVNDQRMAKYDAESKRKQRYMDQFELRHEAAHKGFGFRDEDPDRWNCDNESCARNKGKLNS